MVSRNKMSLKGIAPRLGPYIRYVLLLLGMASLLAAMWGGLGRLGLKMPLPELQLAIYHGPLMVSGFLGTLISLERAVGMGHKWAYIAPASTGLGALMLIAGLPAAWGALFMSLGSLVLLIIFIAIIRLQTSLFTVTMGTGALLWLAGNCLWLTGSPVWTTVFWWTGFLLLMIAGERLELTRIIRFTKTVKAAFAGAIGIYTLGLFISIFRPDAGVRILGLGMMAVTLWLIRYDIAWRILRTDGLPRFMAACLISGYVWLGIAGAIAVSTVIPPAGPIYDAILHTFFLGFVFSMIFAHAPVIFSAVLNLPVAYRPRFYVHLVLLQLSLILRIAGDLSGWEDGREAGGLLNVFVILLFLANTGSSVYASYGKTRAI